MSVSKRKRSNPGKAKPKKSDEWVRVPHSLNSSSDKVVTLSDDFGLQHTCVVAELVLAARVGPRPPGHFVRFKNGDREDTSPDNLEWVAS
jgi:hypothetical protein